MAIFSTILGGCRDSSLPPRTPITAEPLSTETDSPEPFVIIEGGEVPWGDYGSILTHGMTAHLERRGSQLQLERTGPFIPPISFPGINDIVVTTEMRDAMQRAGFRG